jgi:hypothetical protein
MLSVHHSGESVVEQSSQEAESGWGGNACIAGFFFLPLLFHPGLPVYGDGEAHI